MSKVETLPKPVGGPSEEMSVAEVNLGKVLVLIHQTLARLADGCSTADVQAALRKASAFLDMARQAHESGLVVGDTAQTSVEAEKIAIIAAAIAAVLDRPYKLVSVQPATVAMPTHNVWALEGRTQIFQSHKIR